jgi:hypothetical protein
MLFTVVLVLAIAVLKLLGIKPEVTRGLNAISQLTHRESDLLL